MIVLGVEQGSPASQRHIEVSDILGPHLHGAGGGVIGALRLLSTMLLSSISHARLYDGWQKGDTLIEVNGQNVTGLGTNEVIKVR